MNRKPPILTKRISTPESFYMRLERPLTDFISRNWTSAALTLQGILVGPRSQLMDFACTKAAKNVWKTYKYLV